MDMNKPLWQLTVGEFLALQRVAAEESEPATVRRYDGERYVFVIGGIAKLLRCSQTMVHKYRRQGWIEPAIKQHGKKIICDAEMAVELFGKRELKRVNIK